MTKFKKKIFIPIIIFLILSISHIFFYPKIESYFKVKSYLKEQVGNDYIHYFKYQSAEKGIDSPISGNGSQTIYTDFEFIPFSGKHTYIVTTSYDFIDNQIYNNNIPICAFEKNNEKRCEFKIDYSSAYDQAIQTLGNGNISVTIIKDGEKYKWKIEEIIGSPYCMPKYKTFYINTEDGTKTDIEEREERWCV